MSRKQEKIEAKKAMNSNKVLVKYFSAKEMKDVDPDNHIIEIKFAAYDMPDNDRDILVKGCFSKSISERGPESSTNRKIAFLWQHDMHDPIGKIIKIEEKDDGGYATVRLSNFDAVPNAKRAYFQLKDGDINQFSFGFNYVWDKMEYDEESDTFIVKEVKLYEISVVTLGANERTEYIGELENEDEIKSYLKEISIKDKNKFNKIKQMITDIEAEPEQTEKPPLTLNHDNMFEKLAKLSKNEKND